MKLTPPAHLRAPGKALWAAITGEFEPDPRESAILRAACESADRVADARTAIDADGLVVPGRFGVRAHPAVAIERDARAAMVRGLAALGIAAPDGPPGSSTSFPRGRRRRIVE